MQRQLLIFLWIVARLCQAAPSSLDDLRIAVAQEDALTQQIVGSLQRAYPQAQVQRAGQPSHDSNQSVTLAIGPLALRRVLEQAPRGQVIALFIASPAYQALVATLPAAAQTRVTAIYADPDPQQQFRLLAALYQRPVKVAVLLSEKTRYLQAWLEQAWQAQAALSPFLQQSELRYLWLHQAEDLPLLLSQLANTEVLLAVPDSTIYHAQSVPSILLTRYRHQQAVLGFSQALVQAGALASTYSDVEDILAQLDELLRAYQLSGQLTAPSFPKYFALALNPAVARSLNLVLDAKLAQLARQARRQ